MVAALAPRPDGVSGGPESPRRPHGQPPHGLTGLRRLGADVIRRLHLRLLSPRRLGPCRGHIKGRLKLAPMGLAPWAKLYRPPRRAEFFSQLLSRETSLEPVTDDSEPKIDNGLRTNENGQMTDSQGGTRCLLKLEK